MYALVSFYAVNVDQVFWCVVCALYKCGVSTILIHKVTAYKETSEYMDVWTRNIILYSIQFYTVRNCILTILKLILTTTRFH